MWWTIADQVLGALADRRGCAEQERRGLGGRHARSPRRRCRGGRARSGRAFRSLGQASGDFKLVPQRHADDVDQVRVVRGRRLAEAEQRADVLGRGMARRAPRRRPGGRTGSASSSSPSARSHQRPSSSGRSTSTLRPCTRSSRSVRSSAQAMQRRVVELPQPVQHPQRVDPAAGRGDGRDAPRRSAVDGLARRARRAGWRP